jgi:hypothetical protein
LASPATRTASASRTGWARSRASSPGARWACTVRASSARSPTCRALRHLDRVDFTCIGRGDCGFNQFNAAWAAHTLAHESFHLRGYEDEGVTECYALQNTAFVAERLGVPTKQALKLQAWVFEKGYPNEPEDYHSAQCYNGGRLDLRPNSNVFP